VGDYRHIVSAAYSARGLAQVRWAAAMAGSFAVVSRNKYQTFSQKLVQARVYAQGELWSDRADRKLGPSVSCSSQRLYKEPGLPIQTPWSSGREITRGERY